MKIKCKKIHPDAKLPMYATDGSGCFDLYVEGITGERQPNKFGEFLITRENPVTVSTGLSFEVPHGYAMLIFSRRDHGFSFGTRLANCTGVVDSNYRGEVMVKLVQDSGTWERLTVKAGDRIAQAMIVPVPTVEFEETY